MKLLHISTDNRFINCVPSAFETVAKGKNDYWIIHEGQPKIATVEPARVINSNDVNELDLAKEMECYDVVFLHSLIPEFYPFIHNASDHVQFVWLGWGFDYYDLLSERLTLPKTSSLTGGVWRYGLRHLKKKYVTRSYAQKASLFSKIKYFCPVLPAEYDMVKNNYPNLPEYFEWNYGALIPDLIPTECEGGIVDGQNILIGNSATPSNNHLEVLNVVNDLDLGDRKIIMPLNYGEDYYRDKLLPLLNDNIVPITDFVKRPDYIEILQSCSVVVMNHRRQQAFGTIVMMLYMGAKLYLRQENPLYHRLTQWGVSVYSIEELDNNTDDFLIPLSQDQAIKNRDAVLDYFSIDRYRARTQLLIDAMVKG